MSAGGAPEELAGSEGGADERRSRVTGQTAASPEEALNYQQATVNGVVASGALFCSLFDDSRVNTAHPPVTRGCSSRLCLWNHNQKA